MRTPLPNFEFLPDSAQPQGASSLQVTQFSAWLRKNKIEVVFCPSSPRSQTYELDYECEGYLAFLFPDGRMLEIGYPEESQAGTGKLYLISIEGQSCYVTFSLMRTVSEGYQVFITTADVEDTTIAIDLSGSDRVACRMDENLTPQLVESKRGAL